MRENEGERERARGRERGKERESTFLEWMNEVFELN